MTPSESSREVYTFSGWDNSLPSTMSPIIQDFNAAVTEPIGPTLEGYTFADWYIDSAFTTEYVFNVMINESTTLYAKWIQEE